jgi:hypothetical protein
VLAMDQAAATIANTASSIAASMAELNLDPALIEATQQLLMDAADDLSATTFPIMGTIQAQSFGTDHAGIDLSAQHRLAHEVMEKTIDGVAKDVDEFCANLLAAVKLIQNADSDAAADVQRRQEWLEQTQYRAHHTHGDHAHETAQDQVQEPATDPAGGE